MERLKKTLILLFVAAIPAAAPPFLAGSPDICFTAGSVTYQLAPKASAPDMRVRIDNAAAHPDLRLQLVDQAATADFVLVDDGGANGAGACGAAGAHRTVQLVAGPADTTVALTREPADFSLYVHSARVRHEDAAALFALIHRSEQSAELAANR